MADYINQITATNGTTYDIKDTISGYTTNTGTVTQVTAGTGLKIGTATSGGNITTTGTINHTNSVTAQSTQAVYPIEIDAQGHISAYGSAVTVPTKTSELTNDSGFITSDSDEKLTIEQVIDSTSTTNTYYPVLARKAVTNGIRQIDQTGFRINNRNGSADSAGYDELILGNATAEGTEDNKRGWLTLYTRGTNYARLYASSDLTADRELALPNKSGTIALTSDNTDTTYTLSGSLSSHKFTSTLTAGGSGSGTSESDLTLAAGTGISITDDATNNKMTIACTVTNTDTKVSTAAVTSGTQYYPTVGTSTTAAATKYYDTDYGYLASSGTTSTLGYSRLKLGNTTASGTAGNKYGVIRLCGTGANYIDLRAYSVTAARTLTLPDISGNVLAVDSNKLLSSAVKAQASDGRTERVVNVKYGSSAPSGTATTGTVYFQTGSSAYTFVDRTDVSGKSCTTSGTQLASFTLLPGLYLITYQFNCGTISSGTVRCDLKLGSVVKNQVRGASGHILSGSAIVQCIGSSSTITFTGYTTSGTSSSTELHYSYVKLF